MDEKGLLNGNDIANLFLFKFFLHEVRSLGMGSHDLYLFVCFLRMPNNEHDWHVVTVVQCRCGNRETAS